MTDEQLFAIANGRASEIQVIEHEPVQGLGTGFGDRTQRVDNNSIISVLSSADEISAECDTVSYHDVIHEGRAAHDPGSRPGEGKFPAGKHAYLDRHPHIPPISKNSTHAPQKNPAKKFLFASPKRSEGGLSPE